MPENTKLRLDLPLILPDVVDAKDRCVTRLVDALVGRPGIVEAHIREGGESPQLCIHYDPTIINLGRVREIALTAGATLTARFAHLLLSTSRTQHARGARSLRGSLNQLPGVLEAEVAPTGVIRIEYDRSVLSESVLRERINALGIHVGSSADVPTAQVLETSPRHPHSRHSLDDASELAAGPEIAAALVGDEGVGTPAKDKSGGGHMGLQPAPEAHAGHDHTSGGKGHGHPASAQDHAQDHGKESDGHDHGGPFGENSELIFAILAGLVLLVGWLIERSGAAPAWLPTSLFVTAYFFGGFFTSKEAVLNLRARRFEIDTLMLVAAVGAAALGKWAEGALLLFLFSLGHSLEHYAMGRARRAIEALAKLAPDTAFVRRDGGTHEIAVTQLQIGDVVLVRPNERLAADGVVILGTSSVNQAPVTGESVPVDKVPVENPQAALAAFDRVEPANRVFAGTINGSGALEVMVARRAEQSTMARVVKMVTEAQAQRSPTQQFTERFERLFVPAVLVLVGILLFAWVVIDEPFAASFYRAMAVLVAASPCALAISVPSAVLSGVARAARGGVLVKGGGPLENLGTLSSIAFDKTGTLTEGKPKLTDTVPAQGVSEDELLAVALAVESHSDHPLAAAVVTGARARLGDRVAQLAVANVKSITGRGVQATIGAETVHIGKPVLFSELADSQLPADVSAANDQLVASGRSTMIVRQGQRFLGVIGVMDTPRPVAAQVMAQLRTLGIERLIMISGDNQQVADAVAKSVGLTEAKGDLMPEQKVDAIKRLRAEHGKVAMVGDGVNDAPAMANATVGIAMGAAGSDVALETADVALMADDLAQLPFAVGLSRRTSQVIKQNLWVSLGVVAVLIPATIMGLNIGTAVLFHEGSTLLVVVNALRLLAYQSPENSPAPAPAGEVEQSA